MTVDSWGGRAAVPSTRGRQKNQEYNSARVTISQTKLPVKTADNTIAFFKKDSKRGLQGFFKGKRYIVHF